MMTATLDTTALVTMLVQAGPIGIGGIACLEKLFPLVPSYAVFITLGMIVASGQGDLATTVAATAIGSTIGSFCWYGLGFALGERRSETMVERFGRFVFLKPALYRRMANAYRRNHFWVTVMGQTIPAVRVYLSIPAGVLNLAVANFLAATLLGSFAWSAPLLTLGYILRERSTDVTLSGMLAAAALIALEFITLLAWRFIRRAKLSKPSPEECKAKFAR
jgi:membrane protein DedA with SNARE-associated domain